MRIETNYTHSDSSKGKSNSYITCSRHTDNRPRGEVSAHFTPSGRKYVYGIYEDKSLKTRQKTIIVQMRIQTDGIKYCLT